MIFSPKTPEFKTRAHFLWLLWKKDGAGPAAPNITAKWTANGWSMESLCPVQPPAVPGPSQQQVWNTPVGSDCSQGLGPLHPWVSLSVCMTSTTNCTSAASWAAWANDNPLGIQSPSFYRASFCSKWWQRFKSSNKIPAPLQGRQGWQSSPKRAALCSRKGGKQHRLFSFSNISPTSQRRNPSSSSSLEAGTGILLQAEQNKKGVKAEPVPGEHHKPRGAAGVAGGGGLGSATSWKAGREMKSPVSWCSYCKHRL